MFVLICLCLDAFAVLLPRIGTAPAMLFVPALYLVMFCLPSLLAAIALKWAVIGRYRQAEHPMWSRPVWLTEAVTAIYEGLPVPVLLRHLQGTPFLPVCLRLFGTRIGRHVWMHSTSVTEFDLVRIGDEAEISANSGPQIHRFEDRVMKLGPVVLGARSTLGANSMTLPGSRLADGARLGALSLVMKGETIPAGAGLGRVPGALRALMARRLLPGLMLLKQGEQQATQAAVVGMLAVPAVALRFGTTARGKPVLDRPAGAGLSRSHRDGMTLVGAAWRMAVGVDLERVRDDLPLCDVANCFFGVEEAALLRAQPAGLRARCFCVMWAPQGGCTESHCGGHR